MSNGKEVGSRIFAAIFFATLFAGLSLSGCGSGVVEEALPISPAVNTSDTTPPTVSDTSPSNAATGVATNSSVSATFSEAMSNSSLNTSSFTLRRTGGAAVAGTVIANSTTAMFVPSVNLAAGTQYTATVTTAAQDAAGNALLANYTWNFTTGAASDTTPPMVSATSPANATTGVATNSSVSATFSEAMTNSTLNTASFTLVRTTGGAVVGGTVNVGSNTATFTPSAPLAASTQYTATIDAGVTDAAGNMLGADFSWQFTTAAAPDTTRPTVSSTSPANAATGIALNSSVSASFSEAMTNSTLNTTSFTLRPTGGAAVTGTVSVNGNTATFLPSANLAGSTQYTATITTAARDAAGNALATNFTWGFTTAAAPDTTPPTVSATNPANAAAGVALNSAVSATFSETMTNSTLTTASFRMATTSGGTPVTGTVNISGNTATFTPSASLVASTQYTATITNAAKDAAGNSLVANFSWSFTTTTATSNGTATLAWDAVTATNLSGYRVYYGTVPGTYLQPLGQGISVGNVTAYTITGLSSGTRYYFAVTAIDTSNNESTYSNEVLKDIP